MKKLIENLNKLLLDKDYVETDNFTLSIKSGLNKDGRYIDIYTIYLDTEEVIINHHDASRSTWIDSKLNEDAFREKITLEELLVITEIQK